ncbi:MAG TPA: cytochrome ubiquinol oxidase subunit I [Candidatus Omnitrophica bacterium]|nr:MAG: cytochrome D ubiquinol oxidase subunit I [Omnitrophica WOR_2 bacterium GWA2_45_18]HBR14051.1 cytochrome ubiquinol oxidase subunit I [Candidatus Omnitrophota bacterium]
MDLLLLSRIQFALTIAFHYIYPPLSIGLGVILVIMEALYLVTKKPLYLTMAKFWAKIFGLTFAIGVATGVIMEFEFGTNWAAYSRYVGDVFGSALASEGIFAFFLESGFLALLLFGWDKISRPMHFFATLMVCLGAHFSAIWIVVANSWMQTPSGYHIVGEGMKARAEIVDFWAMVFNPSSMERLTHVLMGCWQAGAFLVLSISAYYLLKKQHLDFAQSSMKIALGLALAASIGQLMSGHRGALVVHQYQPAKLAAFEGHFPTGQPADMYLFGWVNEKEEKVQFGVRIPGMLSFLVHGDPQKAVTGLQAFAKEDRPPVNIVFQTYHAMIAIGLFLIFLSSAGCLLLWRNTLFESPWILRLFVWSVLGPQIANLFGWMSAEVGRQPWIVYGLLRTSEGLSRNVTAHMVLTSLILFSIIYSLLFMLFIYLLNKKIKTGPGGHGSISEEGRHRA